MTSPLPTPDPASTAEASRPAGSLGTVLITGGSSGLGAAVAETFSSDFGLTRAVAAAGEYDFKREPLAMGRGIREEEGVDVDVEDGSPRDSGSYSGPAKVVDRSIV